VASLVIPDDRESGAAAPSASLALIPWRNFIDFSLLLVWHGVQHDGFTNLVSE
jgi:hypothetical protein